MAFAEQVLPEHHQQGPVAQHLGQPRGALDDGTGLFDCG
jgi:hypothetical protein